MGLQKKAINLNRIKLICSNTQDNTVEVGQRVSFVCLSPGKFGWIFYSEKVARFKSDLNIIYRFTIAFYWVFAFALIFPYKLALSEVATATHRKIRNEFWAVGKWCERFFDWVHG